MSILGENNPTRHLVMNDLRVPFIKDLQKNQKQKCWKFHTKCLLKPLLNIKPIAHISVIKGGVNDNTNEVVII
jgi:hypothetical protein